MNSETIVEQVLKLVYAADYKPTKPSGIHKNLKLPDEDYRLLRRAIKQLVHDGEIPLLRARLPHGPRHPRAVLALAEALTLWTNRPCRVAVAAVGRGAFCATSRWLDALDWMTRPLAVAVVCVRHDAVPSEPEPDGGLGDFSDLRRMLWRREAR